VLHGEFSLQAVHCVVIGISSSVQIVCKLQVGARNNKTGLVKSMPDISRDFIVKPWLHVQLLHATRCNSCMQ